MEFETEVEALRYQVQDLQDQIEKQAPVVQAAKELAHASMGMGVKTLTTAVKELIETTIHSGV